MKRILFFFFALPVLVPGLARAQTVTNRPFPGLVLYSEVRTNPPERLFVAEVDLKNPHLHLRVAPGGPDPDGSGSWQTTLMQPTKIAARDHFDLVINGDFFDARNTKDGEGTNALFRANGWARVEGPAMTDGRAWSTSTDAKPCLVVHKNKTVAIETRTSPGPDDWEVVAGNGLMVHAGAAVAYKNKVRHPRTVVGLNAARDRLMILVVDGRQPGIAQGMNYDDLAREMLRLGCSEALNLDGGGSSVMAIRENEISAMKILNHPTDGQERAVANVLGISVDQ